MNTMPSYPQHVLQSCRVSWFNRSSRILYFLLVSLALHGLLFSLNPNLDWSTAGAAQTLSRPIYLTLNTTAANQRKPQHARTPVRPAATQQATHPARIAQPHPLKLVTQRHSPRYLLARRTSGHATPARKLRTTQVVIATASPTSDQGIPKPAANPAAVAALLRRALQQHFHYPRIALQNNWEGKVVLGVRVTADGQVGSARVLKPSGFRILDRAAQHAANKIGSLPEAPPLLAGQTLHFRVPVAYRLQH